MSKAPVWLQSFQRSFSGTIRTPLRHRGGKFGADRGKLSNPPAVGAVSRTGLVIYNEQYWLRLYQTMQDLFPLTARLVGFRQFNQLVSAFLEEHPPGGYDLAEMAPPFPGWLRRVRIPATARRGLPAATLVAAAATDCLWQDVTMAPAVKPWQINDTDPASLGDKRFLPSPACRLVVDDLGLLDLRRRLEEWSSLPDDLSLPRPPAAPVRGLLFRRKRQIAFIPLSEAGAFLMERMAEEPLNQALTGLAGRFPETGVSNLAGVVRETLNNGARAGAWTGMTDGRVLH